MELSSCFCLHGPEWWARYLQPCQLASAANLYCIQKKKKRINIYVNVCYIWCIFIYLCWCPTQSKRLNQFLIAESKTHSSWLDFTLKKKKRGILRNFIIQWIQKVSCPTLVVSWYVTSSLLFPPGVIAPHALVSIQSLSLCQTCPGGIFQSQKAPLPSQAQILINLKIESDGLLPPSVSSINTLSGIVSLHTITWCTAAYTWETEANNTSQYKQSETREGCEQGRAKIAAMRS